LGDYDEASFRAKITTEEACLVNNMVTRNIEEFTFDGSCIVWGEDKDSEIGVAKIFE